METSKVLKVGAKRLDYVLESFLTAAKYLGMCSAQVKDGKIHISNVLITKLVLGTCSAILFAHTVLLTLKLNVSRGSELMFYFSMFLHNFTVALHLWMIIYNLTSVTAVLVKLSAVFGCLKPDYKKYRRTIRMHTFMGLLLPIGVKIMEIVYSALAKEDSSSVAISSIGMMCRKIPISYSVTMFCVLSACIEAGIASLNLELKSELGEKRVMVLQLCYEIMHETSEMLNKLFGLQLLLILVGSNAFFQTDVFSHFKVVFNILYDVESNEKREPSLVYFAWIFFDSVRIITCFVASCAVTKEVLYMFNYFYNCTIFARLLLFIE